MRKLAWGMPLLALSCMDTPTPGPTNRFEPPTPSAQPASPRPSTSRSQAKPEFVAAPAGGPVDASVRSALSVAQRDERELLVYVGADWCEPCQAFHDAVASGRLDERLSGVRFFEFDLDRDRDRLNAAGYGGQLVPRFIKPEPTGRGGQRVEGTIKGDGMIDTMLMRIEPLL